MRVIRSLAEVPAGLRSCATIGNFDGVHVGHARLIRRVMAAAASRGLSSVALTFDPHPLRVLSSRKTPPFITPLDLKIEQIERLGPDFLVVLPFTRELAATSPEEFVRAVLVGGLGVRHLVVGYDYSFGKNRAGDYRTLSQLGAALSENQGFTAEQMGPVFVHGAVVSSTRVRDVIQAGEVWEARALLGRFFEIKGVVAEGKRRGAGLGFPTANVRGPDELLPKTGVYATWFEIDGVARPSVTNVGLNPTFGDLDAVSVETHVLDFSGDLYGREVRLRFVARLRGEKKFDNIEQLKARIAEDVKLARAVLANPEANSGAAPDAPPDGD